MNHKPFWVIADYLTRQESSYRERTIEEWASTGKSKLATVDDMAGDLLARVELLNGRKEISAKPIGLIGHSEGGIVAPLAAS